MGLWSPTELPIIHYGVVHPIRSALQNTLGWTLAFSEFSIADSLPLRGSTPLSSIFSFLSSSLSHVHAYICAPSPHSLILSRFATSMAAKHANVTIHQQETSTASPITRPKTPPAYSLPRAAKSTPKWPLMKALLPRLAAWAALTCPDFIFCV